MLSYDPQPKPQRGFEEVYPNGTVSDETGKLRKDIEGRPLTAKHVIGRRTVGGVDEAIAPAEFDAIATEATGREPTPAPARQMGQDAGRLIIDKRTGRPISVLYRRDLTGPQRTRTIAHEVGHIIDELAGQIPTKE